MTLKEKFKNILIDWIDEYYNREHIAEVIEIDADNYAIEFAEWLDTLIDKFGFLEYKRNYINKTKKELLEIFKKEKGL
jgi:endonuclease III